MEAVETSGGEPGCAIESEAHRPTCLRHTLSSGASVLSHTDGQPAWMQSWHEAVVAFERQVRREMAESIGQIVNG